MKKILAIFVVMVMCFTSNVSEVDAATKTKGIIYYRIELAKTATLTSGTYFLSNGDSFEDLSYVSFTFPTNISDACVRVTGPLNPGSYYGKDKGSTKYTLKASR